MGKSIKPLPRLRVNENQRYIEDENGKTFFWLGDTAWELFHRLDLEEAIFYFRNRQAKRFTLVQAVALAEFDGLNTPNINGDHPLINADPLRPNEPYWLFVDEIIRQAEKCGLYVGLLPTWGDKVADSGGVGPIIFNPDNAYAYGEWLGRRYRQQTNIVWIMGGDRPVAYTGKVSKTLQNDLPVWRAMAEGIRVGVNFPLVMTFHPCGGRSSSEFIHSEAWLDVNMMQSGHGSGHDVPVWDMITRDRSLLPIKPTLDGEPNYEDHPVNPWPTWDPATGYYDDYDVRKQLYRSVLSGGCGVTYGHHSVWQMASPRFDLINHAKMYWREAIDRPGACQVRHLHTLIGARPVAKWTPDQSMLKEIPVERNLFPCAVRDEGGKFAVIYLPASNPVTVDLGRLDAGQVNAWWYNPRTGKVLLDGKYSSGAFQTLTPPENGPDWVLVLDDVAAALDKPI